MHSGSAFLEKSADFGWDELGASKFFVSQSAGLMAQYQPVDKNGIIAKRAVF